jgi:hypothetical protein
MGTLKKQNAMLMRNSAAAVSYYGNVKEAKCDTNEKFSIHSDAN